MFFDTLQPLNLPFIFTKHDSFNRKEKKKLKTSVYERRKPFEGGDDVVMHKQ